MSKPFWELGVNPITMWKDESVERYINQKKRAKIRKEIRMEELKKDLA